MNFTDRFTDALDPVLLLLSMAWSITVISALL